MKILELKISPLALTTIFFSAMWLVSIMLPPMHLYETIRIAVVIVFTLTGAAFGIWGLLNFSKAKTTFDPMKPYLSRALVTSGAYSISRNPMYTGLVSLLIAWSIFLESAYSLLLVAVFIVYMNKFQIEPEERALNKIFGDAYGSYVLRVRRWL